jgi:general L-amino acid transport system ATP-binding protein
MKVSDEVAIEIQNMNKWYGDFPRAARHRPHRHRGEKIVICGPSGSGKSTLIRCINASGGASARLDRRRWHGTVTNDLKNIDKIRSEVGMVFQHFNLFPHLT